MYYHKLLFVQFIVVESKCLSLERENQKLRDEFDLQRAKMKDLFLQKEGK